MNDNFDSLKVRLNGRFPHFLRESRWGKGGGGDWSTRNKLSTASPKIGITYFEVKIHRTNWGSNPRPLNLVIRSHAQNCPSVCLSVCLSL